MSQLPATLVIPFLLFFNFLSVLHECSPSLWRGIVGEAFSQLYMLHFHLLMQENLSRFLKAFGVLGRQVSA